VRGFLYFFSVVFVSSVLAQSEEEQILRFERYKDRVVHFQNSSLDTSRLYLDSCFITAEKISNQFYIGDALQLRSRDFFLRSYPDSALYYGKKAVEVFKNFPDSSAFYVAEYNVGNIYLGMGDYIQGLLQFKKVLRIIDENFEILVSKNDAKINLNRAYCYFSIGLVFDYLNDYENKLKNLQKALKISYKVNTRESEIFQAITYSNIGMAYCELGDYEQAENYAIRSLDLKKRLGIENTSGYNYQVMARSAFGRKKYTLALKYLQFSDKSFVQIQNLSELYINKMWRAKCFIAQKKSAPALELLHSLENVLNQKSTQRELVEVFDLLSEVYAFQKDYTNSLKYLRKRQNLKDELSLKNTKNAVNELINYFEEEETRINDKIEHFKVSQEKEKLQMEVKAQKEKQVWVYSVYLISTVCLILIIIVIARGNRRNKRINQELNYSIDEKQILFKEVHHRVKNNFQIISSLLNLQQGIEEDQRSKKVLVDAQSRIQSMSLVHEMLYRKNEVKRIDFRSYAFELVDSIIKSYSNKPENIYFEINCGDESFDLELAVPLGLMLNEAVTNSVKYAFLDNEAGKIVITLKPIENKKYLLIIHDNGVGIKDEFINGSKETLGIELITILSAQLGGSVKFLNSNGTEVRITFNVID